MKALTVCQPWAWAIIHGPKRVENRTWPTSYRGPLAIHAGKTRDWFERPGLGRWFERVGLTLPAESQLDFGAILGVVQLVDCVRVEELRDSLLVGSPHLTADAAVWADGPWCWVLKNPRILREPLPWRGAQSLWEVQLPELVEFADVG
jgi:hypothetical protein